MINGLLLSTWSKRLLPGEIWKNGIKADKERPLASRVISQQETRRKKINESIQQKSGGKIEEDNN